MTFKPLELGDRAVFRAFLTEDPPQVSELTFTNLFMWRGRNRPIWKEEHGCLIIIMQPQDSQPYGFQPVGSGDKQAAVELLLDELTGRSPEASLCRVDERFVARHVDTDRYDVIEDRDNNDYVYLARELIELPGNRFHKKRNHVNKFIKSYAFEYRPLDQDLVECFLRLQEDWCELKNCEEDQDLFDEDRAVYEALIHMEELDFRGGAILIDSRVEAFSLGEHLNPDTVVIHIEKANPRIPGLYAAINQRFCQEAWMEATYINREQDLGVAGLRKAKESYHPHRMIRKFRVTRKPTA
jgi:uncharacterized protein